MDPMLPILEQAVRIFERPRRIVVVVEGDVEELEAVHRLDMAVELGRITGKQVVVDLSGVGFFSGAVLHVLLAQLRRGGGLPWLAGPLSTVALRRLEVTGTAPHFRIFPTLFEAMCLE
ncbi:hypothetical protein [Streptomyces rubiginosohelvolus]|uniref:hypothetical protein n=1 Tax=Streptomyces rubiginosohelvolus TaxID=67362 RepID=UPI0035E30304